MTRRYSLQRLQKDVLLGVSGVTLASTMLFSSPTMASIDIQTRNNRDMTNKTATQIKRAEKASLKMQKKNALREENFLE
ncbi:hypothetical protein SDC9_21739 [bioreactor metagenome]|uniref:Uncharacterized protein n=1 Tax=bioreactor metagenome TaxID=1076179 RepID=A0A644UAA9_9ZZZZ|nr:hypothetical protein [Candidatus Elulimicrobiales bacterium]